MIFAIHLVIYDRITRSNIISGKYKQPSNNTGREAAVKIQRYWRFYRLIMQARARQEKWCIQVGTYIYNNYNTTLKFNFF